MAQPAYTGLDTPFRKGANLEILDIGHGDWKQGQSLQDLANPKWVAVVLIDGKVVYGETPRMPSVPASQTYSGELGWDRRLELDLAKAGYADGRAHILDTYIYAASFFKGWGDHPDDAYEWGHFSVNDPGDQSTPARFHQSFTIAAAQPPPVEPPPPPPSGEDFVTAALHDVRAGLELLRQSQGYKTTKANNPNMFLKTLMGRAESAFGSAEWHLDNRK